MMESGPSRPEVYHLPDGTKIDLGEDRMKIPESLFGTIPEVANFNGI